MSVKTFGRAHRASDPSPYTRDELADLKRGDAWSAAQQRMQSGSVSVTTSAGTYNYGIDAETRENLAGLASVVAQIGLGNLPANAMPDPRPFTPKGEVAPINLTHAELVLVAVAVAGGKDAVIQAYLAHKAWIKDPARTIPELESYDLTQGWP